MLLSFFHTCASKQHHSLHDRESPILSLSYTSGKFHYRTWLVYSNDGLPQNSHHTYLLWHFHSHSEIYCHATFHHSIYYDTLHLCHIALHDHVVDIGFVAKPPVIFLSYMSLLSHCTSRYTAGGIHLESYLVLSIEL